MHCPLISLFVFLCILGICSAAPQSNFQRTSQPRRDEFISTSPFHHAQVLRSDISPVFGAIFRYLFETDNGIYTEKEGYEGINGQSNMRGSYRYLTPEGITIEVHYTADESGYHPQSDAIPTPHPMPAHALEQIRIAEEQRAQGIRWDERGFRI